MKKWKIIIECKGKTSEVLIKAKYYSDAYLEAKKKYSECVVKSITEIRN